MKAPDLARAAASKSLNQEEKKWRVKVWEIDHAKTIKLREGTPDPTTAGRSVKEIIAALKAKGFDPSRIKFTQSVEVETPSDQEEDHREDAIDGTATETQD